jgi:murein DD-endopeptidase MepM/ murein hydrolase activator NlpD
MVPREQHVDVRSSARMPATSRQLSEVPHYYGKLSSMHSDWHVAFRARQLSISTMLLAIVALDGCRGRPRILSGYDSMTSVSGARREHRHTGVDVEAETGTDVVASAPGIVSNVERQDRSGFTITIRHDRVPVSKERGPTWTAYGHLRSSFVVRGQRVKRGEIIGSVGLFWASGGVAHVHWSLCRDAWCLETEDPLRLTRGCFSTTDPYPDRLVLTLPIGC